MSTPHEWRAPKDVPCLERARIPVSVATLPDGTQAVVSRFGDNVWDLYPYIPQENLSPRAKTLSWMIRMPDGHLLTDEAHQYLLESAKAFVWVGFMNPPEGRPRPKALTLIKTARQLTPLLRWMVDSGIKKFSDIGAKISAYIPEAKLSTRANSKGIEVTPDTIAQRLTLVEDLFRQRHKLEDAIQVHPWPLETACSLAGFNQSAAHRVPKTQSIPDDLVAQLAKAAIAYVERRAPTLLEALEATNTCAEAAANNGATSSRQADVRTASARKHGFNGFNAIVSEAIRLRTACYIVIGMFSGLRDSEMMSLEVDCIRERAEKDSGPKQIWLHGTIYKTGTRPKRWLVPQVVQAAVTVLTRLTEPQRVQLSHEFNRLQTLLNHCIPTQRDQMVRRLTLINQQRHKLFLGMRKGSRYGGPSSIAGSILNDNLKSFCHDLGINGPNGTPYQLHAHQFRRTYARFVARSELGDLAYLQEHFGHHSLDMTLLYAEGSADAYEADSELLELISQEKQNRQFEVVSAYLISESRLANGGHWLTDWRRTVQTAKNKDELIKEFAGTITLNGTGHSWCIGNARGIGCGGLCMMQAQMCVDCNYGVIGEEHRPVWEGIRDQQLEALALDDIGPGGRERAREILHDAERVLRRLDGAEGE